jgi:DNA-binding transcriptional ArsR family regulator
MEHETLFTASKWHILKALELQPRSPLELAKVCNTSVANVSQQLRLLEMAGLVTSKRISNRDKDKPRVLYSLNGDLSYLISTSGNFVDKKLVHLSDYNKIIMRIWFFERPDMRYLIEKAFWRIEERLDKLTFLAFNKSSMSPLVFYYRTGTKLQLKPFTLAGRDGVTRQIIFETALPSAEQMYVLHDPLGIAQEKKRGGGK